MDIIITLPKDLWTKIVTGEKSVEMRKWNLPVHFDVTLDHIYVVLKGTRRVVGCFKVERVAYNFVKRAAWEEFGDKLGVSFEWFSKYWGDKTERDMCFFFIGNSHVLGGHRKIEVAHAPQKYMNIDKSWESLVHF